MGVTKGAVMSPFDFDQPQFSTKELLECVPGLNPETYKQWLKRDEIHLTAADEMGRGKRVQHTGTDVVQVATRYVLIPHGQFVSKFPFIWPVVQGRIIARQTGLITTDPGPISAMFYLHPTTGELRNNSFSESDGVNFAALADPAVPTLQLMFGIDRFIDRMVEQMQHVKAGTKAANPPTARQPLPDDLEYDAAGNVVLAGLTLAESQQYATMAKFLDDGGKFSDESEKSGFYAVFVPLDRKHALAKAVKLIDKANSDKDGDFMRRWMKDRDGNYFRVGLTVAETEELRELDIKKWADRSTKCATIWSTVEEEAAASRRYLELHDKHEMARQKRLGEEFKQRIAVEHDKRLSDEKKQSTWKFWK